ncbi:MAG: hypothetical protein WCK28_06885 [Burkholderiales bacterium]
MPHVGPPADATPVDRSIAAPTGTGYPRPMTAFDTALMEALLSVGIPPERARAVVDTFDRAIDGRCSLHAEVLATKRDLAEMETRLTREIGETRERIAAVDARITSSEGRVAERIASIEGRVAETKTELLKWVLGALTAQNALLLSAMKLF